VPEVTRFAPSPTGLLHLGHVHAALRAWGPARATGGLYLLRLEDIDAQRCRPAFAAAIVEDLAWLGLAGDGPVRVQSAHMAAYAAVLAGLSARGLVYPCFCSRADVARELAACGHAPHGPDGAPLYPGTCRGLEAGARAARLAAGAPHAWRLDMAAALRAAPALRFHDQGLGWVTAGPAGFGDVVLGRRDVPASYHLCVTHDDAVQGVTLVTRGEDLLHATHLHVLLQHLLGWPTPAYAHHGLLRGADGVRLSKRDGALSVRALREAGMGAQKVKEKAREGLLF
jgi:glutamyl-Q tRNA(Asp) synthetase